MTVGPAARAVGGRHRGAPARRALPVCSGPVSITDTEVEDALASFEAFLRRKRLKMTAQRRTMIRTALKHVGHFTAEDLYRRLTEAGAAVSMATVYRGLTLLEEAKLLEGHDFDGTRRYERLVDREHHDHMICLDCQRVLEFQDDDIESLQEKAAKRHGFDLADRRLVLYVRCPEGDQPERCHRAESMRTA